jgi:hypothetical protein
MLSHLLLDLPTPMGVMLFFPSRNDVHLDFLGYFDWTLFTVALCVLLAAWTYAKRSAAVRRGVLSAVLLSALSWWLFAEWPTLAFSFTGTVEEATDEPLRTVYPLVLGGILLSVSVAFARKGWGFRQNRAVFGRIGVAALSIYLAWCATAQGIALSLTQEFTRERGIVVRRRAASRMGCGFSKFCRTFSLNSVAPESRPLYDGAVPVVHRSPLGEARGGCSGCSIDMLFRSCCAPA